MKQKIFTEVYKDNLGRKIVVTFDNNSARIRIEDKKVEEIVTKKSFESRRKYWKQIEN